MSPVPTSPTLAGASLAVSQSGTGFSNDAPLFYASGGQLNIQIPWEARPFDTITVTPTVNGVKGDAVKVNIQFFAPGIFTVDQSGKGQGAVTNALTGQLAAPAAKYPNSQPVKRGGYLSIYCTGLGPVDNPSADGAAASAKPLANTVITPTVTIGTVTATVTFSGLAPGYIGLNQVNVQVPQTAPTGDAVPLSISDGFGGVSNTVTVAIQ